MFDATEEALDEVATLKVVGALDLPKALYADDPEVRLAAELQTKRAFRDLLCYRISTRP